MHRRRLGISTILLATALLVLAPLASAHRPAHPTERRAINVAIGRYWCANLPRDLRPCSSWKLHLRAPVVSTTRAGWALAQFSATGDKDQTGEVSTLQNVFVHQRAGTWGVSGWFLSLVYGSCAKAAQGTKVPQPVLDDFGLCDRLVRTL